MKNQTSTTARTIVQGYRWVGVQQANGGFGEYQASAEKGHEYYADAIDLIEAAYGTGEYVRNDKRGWENHKDTELVECISDVSGAMYDEPEILVALRDYEGRVTVFGIDSIDCYEQVSGEYVPVTDYDDNPESYTLA